MRRLFLGLAAASLAVSSVFAIEPKSDLSLEVRVVDTVVSKGRGIARIEIALDSFRDAEDIELTLERPGGTRASLRPEWKNAQGLDVLPGPRGIAIGARGRLVTRFTVPIEGAGTHPVVVRATARSGAGEMSTEGFVLVPDGASPVVVEDGVANFPVKEAN